MAEMSPWEYTQDTCDVWELHHLCNHFAGFGWEVVAVVPGHPNVKVTARIGDETGPLRVAMLPYVVLFRRPITEKEHADG